MRDLREGDAIGAYVLERAIDRGAFGRVWRARDTASGRTVAIKVLGSTSPDEEHARARSDLERLAAAAARDSRHIVRVLGGGHEPVPHIVMEFVDGTNIRDELAAKGPLPQEEVIRIGLELADALRALHRVRIVHRDVKPANILLDQQGEVRLTDFGIAKILGYEETVTLTQQNLLSAPYAAPEVWEGAPNPSSDLYAFGAVLFEMLAGRPPFQGDLMDLFRQHRSDEADMGLLPAPTAPSLRELLHQCLRKSLGERPPNAEACIRMLERAREELRPEPEQFGPWVRVEPHPEQPWAWRCVHERTGEAAVVEVHFAQDEAYGEALKAAVNVNPKLVPLGSEKLLGANRLLLKDNEGWPSAPEHNLVFWVAREEGQPPEPGEEIGQPALLKATESFIKVIEVASSGGVRLSIDSTHAIVGEDGSVWLLRPGLPPRAPVEPRLGAFIFLRSLALSPEAAEVAARARDLRDLRDRLSRPAQGEPGARQNAGDGRSAGLLLGVTALALAVLVAAGIFAAAGGGGIGDGSQGNASPTAGPSIALCGSIKLPVSLDDGREACAGAGDVAVELSTDCARGQVCAIESKNGGVVLRANDQTIAFVDANGDLALAREGSFVARRLVQDGSIRQPSWSPEGRYLAYIVSRTVAAGEERDLWVLDTQDLASPALVFTSTDGPSIPEWRRRRLSHPQWSADGKSLYFFWNPSSGAEEIWTTELPQRSGAVDIRELRLWNGSPRNLASLRPDVGPGQAAQFTSFTTLADGGLLVEYCVKDQACGLARWDGSSFAVLIEPRTGARFISPQPYADQVFALALDGADAIVISADSAGQVRPIARIPATIGFGEADPNDLSLSISPDGSRALAGTAAGLALITLSNGDTRPLVAGRWARWFASPPAAAGVSPPPATPFATPGLTPSPPPAPTFPPGGEADLTGDPVVSTCGMGQQLSVRIRNLGPSAVDRDVFLRIATLDGQTRQGTTNIGLTGLLPGEEREVRTTYTVREAVQVFIEYARDRKTENNSIACSPRP